MPGLPHPEYSYGFQIPVLLVTPRRNVLAFAQAYVVRARAARPAYARAHVHGGRGPSSLSSLSPPRFRFACLPVERSLKLSAGVAPSAARYTRRR